MLTASAPKGARIEISYQGTPVTEGVTDEDGCGSAVLPPEQLHLWSPEAPNLYDVTVTLGDDTVKSYFAMRTVGTGIDAAGHPCLLLNGQPYFHHGVLDQGYWPDGLYTAPSDDALIYDIELMKRLGFKHAAQAYQGRAHALVLSLRPAGHAGLAGHALRRRTVQSADHLRAAHHRHSSQGQSLPPFFARTDAQGREDFTRELTELITQLQNCPCIVLWVPFNEGWGQFDAKNAVRLIRRLDPTRLIDHASGWHDQGVSDVKSLHVYFKPYRFRPDKKGRAVVLSEFGGYNLPVAGHTWNTKNFGYKRAIRRLRHWARRSKRSMKRRSFLHAERGLAADVYTQLSDVEDEVNGFVTYDRRVEKLPEALMQAIAQELRGD